MDHYDREILAILQDHGRATHSEISQRISLSIPAVSERVRKLEQQGYIKKFTALLSSKIFGKTLTAFIAITLEHPRFIEAFLEQVVAMPDVLECHHVAGDEDYWLKVVTENTDALEELLDTLKRIEGLRRTKTTIALSTVKEEPSIVVSTTD